MATPALMRLKGVVMRLRIGLMLRLYTRLSSLVGNNVEHMGGWMGTSNQHTGGIPAKQLKNSHQLERLVGHLEAVERQACWHLKEEEKLDRL